MEHELFNDNDSFEQFLRESTEHFKMYPSRKVWYSLYNNLHPGRKWPSLAVCLILVAAILFMDVSNNNKINKRSLQAADSPIANRFTDYFTKFEEQKNKVAILAPLANIKGRNNIISEKSTYSPANTTENNTVVFNEKKEISNVEIVTTNSSTLNEVNIKSTSFNKVSNLKNLASLPTVINSSTPDNNLIVNIQEAENQSLFISKALNTTENNDAEIKNKLSESLLMKAYQDDHAFYNKPLLSKFMKNAKLEFYITPSIGYRAWFQNKAVNINNNNALIAVNPNNSAKEEVNQNAAYNMEVGLALNYSISKKLSLKMGVQFNNTNYVINAGQLFHPTQTTLLLENSNTGISNLEPHTSYYSNRQALGNEKRLFNKTTQFSLPVGIDYELSKKKNISFHAAASIQPTYVAAGDANLLSADARNYVKMPSLLRTWNANTSIETYVSIDTKAGFSLNVGPQFRYQLLSTYSNDYNYSEKLYNIGIKLGITRGF